MKRILSLLLFITISTFYSFSVEIRTLRCESLRNPESIGTDMPRLSWEIVSEQRGTMQTAFHIMAATSPGKLEQGEADLWDSGKTESPESIFVPYAGKKLASRTDVYWKVKVYTNRGESGWSQPARFGVGLLSETDWTAKWIGNDRDFPCDIVSMFSRLSVRYYRKEFSAKKTVKSAKAYISGLGLYELYINGKKIGHQVLAPAPTDYRKTVMYNTFDVTEDIRNGKNAIGTMLGNGRYFAVRQNYRPDKILTFGFPKLLFQLEIEYADGTKQTVAGDNTWKMTVDGPIRANNEWDGEEYDARREMPGWNDVEFNDKGWINAEFVQVPGGIVKAQPTPNMIVHETVTPVSIKEIKPEIYILDMGQNMVGWLQIKAQGKRGNCINLRFAETLNPDGTLYTDNLRSARCNDIYTMKGEGIETWEPSFVYHGFRYVEITGYPGKPTVERFKGKVVYDEMATTGSFESSDKTLNALHKNAYWGIRGNYKGMPVDCPQRDERQPWLGDRAAGCLGESFIFDNEALYLKWMDDIRDAQTPEGRISDISPPFYLIYYTDNMTWPGTYLMVADMLYRQFGNVRAIKEHYPYMKKWFFYMKDKYMKDYILTKDKYGDWCVPPESPELIHSKSPDRKTDGQLIATAYFYLFAGMLQKFADLSNNSSDMVIYVGLQENVRQAFNRRFFKDDHYDNNTVTANLLPLAFGITDPGNEEAVFGSMTEKIVNTDNLHLSTGVIGTQWLMHELTRRGRADVAYRIASQTDYPSWGYMIENGATTIWELWNGNTADPKMNSHNHVMLLGDVITWMYEDLGGIKAGIPGFRRIKMKPHPTETLSHVNATHHSPYGLIGSNWNLTGDRFEWTVTVPANSTAEMYIPASTIDDVSESGNPVTQRNEIKFTGYKEDRVCLEIGSGVYRFSCRYGNAGRWKKGIVSEEKIFERALFPESHAATIAETKEGRLVAAWFGGTKEKNPDVCIWTSTLIDGKWTEPRMVADGVINDTLRYPCWNPVLYQVPGKELQLYYKVGPNVPAWWGERIVSTDGGNTWSRPEKLPEGMIGPVKNKPVLLKDGTLISPSSTEDQGWSVHLEISRDFGKTWKKTAPLNDSRKFKIIQPSVLTYADGRLQILCRSQQRAVVELWSRDNGKTWSEPAKTGLPNNNSGTDAVTLKDDRQLIVYNHVLPIDTIRGKGTRTPLNVAVSDDGKTWYAALVLEDSPISGQYSYPAVIQTPDGMVHVVYTWRRQSIKHIQIDPSKLVLSKIENMQWPEE